MDRQVQYVVVEVDNRVVGCVGGSPSTICCSSGRVVGWVGGSPSTICCRRSGQSSGRVWVDRQVQYVVVEVDNRVVGCVGGSPSTICCRRSCMSGIG